MAQMAWFSKRKALPNVDVCRLEALDMSRRVETQQQRGGAEWLVRLPSGPLAESWVRGRGSVPCFLVQAFLLHTSHHVSRPVLFLLLLVRCDWKGLTASTVEQTVSNLDGIVNRIRGRRIVDLPETEAHEGHLMARV